MRKTTFVTLAVVVVAAVAGVVWWKKGGDKERKVAPAADFVAAACALPPRWMTYIVRGWDAGPARDQDIILVPRQDDYFGNDLYTSHAGPYDYLQEVPLIFFGPGHIRPLGTFDAAGETTVADLAATQARLLDFSMPKISGEPIEELLEKSNRRPRLILVASIDGGGWNVLREWPNAWPFLRSIIKKGASPSDAVVGSSPSITPPVHTTMSTGVFPRDHGVTGIGVRSEDGTIVGGFAADPDTGGAQVADPTINLTKQTVADAWDLQMSNEAKVALVASGNYPLGLLGSGSAISGADQDIAAMSTAEEEWATNLTYYELPTYLEDVEGPAAEIRATDLIDGELDGLWHGHDIPLESSPALAPWTTRAAQAILQREAFGQDAVTDLMYLHYKAPDLAGHQWNMTAIEQRDVLASVDTALDELTQWLNRHVGEQNYVLAVTADHGQTRLGGWGINAGELKADIDRAFDITDNGKPLVQRSSPTSLFMNVEEMERNEVTPERIAAFLTAYTVGNNALKESEWKELDISPDRPLFAAAFPGRAIEEISRCVRTGGPS